MGFDNTCVVNIQSLPGEYFCPVCGTLVYPHEAIQTQCTHLYCKPCLSHIVNTSQACPYDGYLVTEASSKLLMESNKVLAETIGKTTVRCLYIRSGCVWQGSLSECITHCYACAFGNFSRGTDTQPQRVMTAPDANLTAPPSQPRAYYNLTRPSAADQNLNPPATVVPRQQYYQQYPGYDPDQQPYQQYYPYQQVQPHGQSQTHPLKHGQPQFPSLDSSQHRQTLIQPRPFSGQTSGQFQGQPPTGMPRHPSQSYMGRPRVSPPEVGPSHASVNRRNRNVAKRPCAESKLRHVENAKIRMATMNVETLDEKFLELADVLTKRRVVIACIQKTQWKGSGTREGKGTREGNGYKLWYSGADSTVNGVGIMLSSELVDNVVEVNRCSDRIMALRVVVEDTVLNVVCAYAPHVGSEESEKRTFWESLDDLVGSIPEREYRCIGGNFNGHIGAEVDGFPRVHGGYGFGVRNEEGRTLLEFATAHDLMVLNSFYKKKDMHLITFRDEDHTTQVDYFLLRKRHFVWCRDCKVLPGESLGTQHRLLVMDLLVDRVRGGVKKFRTRKLWNDLGTGDTSDEGDS